MDQAAVSEAPARAPAYSVGDRGARSLGASVERAAAIARASCLVAVLAVLVIDQLGTSALGGAGWLFLAACGLFIVGTSALTVACPAPQRLQVPLLVADVLMITGVIYLSGGIESNFFPLYYLPILQAAVRLNMRHGIGISVLVAALYGLLGCSEGIEVEIPTTAYMRILSFGGSTLFMAGGFALLMSQTRRYQHYGLSMARLVGELEEKTASLERLNEELVEKNQQLEQTTCELTDTQSRLIAAEKLASVGQLAASVGHELRNPLGVIRNCLYCLRSLPGENGRAAEFMDLADAKIAESDAIVAALLDFSRGKPSCPTPTDFAHVLEAALSAVEKPDGIQLTREIESLPEQLLDGAQLEHAFRNIITNAYQAMGETGTLTVRAEGTESEVRIEVSDTGPGIEEANLDRIFEPLFTTKAKGIGLGLVQCKKTIQQNGGTIDVANGPGGGAVFTIRFPRGAAVMQPDGQDNGDR